MTLANTTQRVALAAGVWLLSSAPVCAQANLQLWGHLMLDWATAQRLGSEIEIAPKGLVAAPAGTPGWWSLEVTPSLSFAAKNWLDLDAELLYSVTHQADHLRTNELTPRLGARFHLFSRDLPAPMSRLRIPDERRPKRRLVLRDFVRMEYRSLFYPDQDEPTSSALRFRNRVELLRPLNKDNLTDDHTRYFLADWEWFVPLSDPKERFANKQRIRIGLGYRHDETWRIEGLYIWQRSRNNLASGFKTTDHIVDIRLKKVF